MLRRSLDAFLDLQHINQILAGEISDLKQKIEKIEKEWGNDEIEKEMLKKEWEKEIMAKEAIYEKFPGALSPLQAVIIKIVYSEKHARCKNLIELLQDMTTSTLLRQEGLSFCLTKYKGQPHPEAQTCICLEGFSIIHATVNLLEWKESP